MWRLTAGRRKYTLKIPADAGNCCKRASQSIWKKRGNPGRKTAYDLVAVEKGGLLVNMDSAAPNLAAGEWLASGGLLAPVKLIKPECTYGNSRFDFYVESEAVKMWLEVKGVTLETQRTALFPDAPLCVPSSMWRNSSRLRKTEYEGGDTVRGTDGRNPPFYA